MRREWPEINYERWRATCDTLHAHTQTLGKLAVALAPPEPQLQHAALRLTARGWETPPLPAPGGAGAIVVALDLRTHAAVVEHSGGRQWRIPLMPDRAVGAVAQEVLQAVGEVAGVVEINLTTQEVWWSVALDEDTEHARYDADAVASYFAAATSAALVLGEYRAAYRGRSTPVNAWWGSFDLAVNLFSGAPADPPSDDLITRNAMDAEEIAVGWWPGDPGHGTAALYAYAHPAPDRLSVAPLSPEAAYWDEGLGEYLLEWDEVVRSGDPHRYALDFAQSAFDGFFAACGWDPWLWGGVHGSPPPVR